MEIRHTPAISGERLALVLGGAVSNRGCGMEFTSVRGACVRFRLIDADEADHDHIIRALLTLDPDATVRTARAVYEGLADFETQYKARNGGEK